MSDDDLFREVNEELRREQMKKLWDKIGPLVIGGAVAIVVIIGGSQWWAYEKNKTAVQNGVIFSKALYPALPSRLSWRSGFSTSFATSTLGVSGDPSLAAALAAPVTAS